MNKLMIALIAALTLGLAACAEPDGPAERLGQSIDDAVGEVSDAAGDVGNEIEDACEELKEGAGASDTDC